MGNHGFRRTRTLCRAQQSSITRSRTPAFHKRIRSFTMRQRLPLLEGQAAPQPPLVALLVRHVLLREFLPQIGINSIVLRTSRMSTARGLPPRGLCLAGGISGATMAHCSSVRSEGYAFRERSSCTICAHSSAVERGANYLRNLLFCQVMFPDSL